MSLPTTTQDLRHFPETQQPRPTTDHYHNYSNSITLTFTQFFSLLGTLLALKFYYGLYTLSHGKRPTHQSIKELEHRIVALFQAIVPEGLYRMDSRGPNLTSGSGAASRRSFPCDSDGKKSGNRNEDGNGSGNGKARSVASASTQRTQPGDGMIDLHNATTQEGSAHSPLMRVTTNIAPAIRMSQGLSKMSGEQLVRTVTAGTTIAENIPEMSLDNSNGDNRQSFTSCQAYCGSMSSAAPPPVSIYTAYRPGTPSSTLTYAPPQNTPESGTPITTSIDRLILQARPPRSTLIGRYPTEEEERWPVVSQRELTNESEEESPTRLTKWPGVEQEQSRSSVQEEEPPKNEFVKWRFGKEEVSPTDKDDIHSPIYDAERVETESDSDGDENEDKDPEGGLKLIRSAESYPGKFPVSEGLPLTALATAPICVRGKAQTSVRPLSEV
ncbi:uncharacterized protein EURHEDRAFT_527299 [Aspergillus ruber CBS 135680]|uniref:Uncharacterized protein n=1 Tax=Aspergillus ruber (strain CBS 135680) TaxID=1388766 RepID=A0A017S1N9_ASPRC|nr:uncharacterized protein EURHEDRAFT_527299 [Aspergillus ruber CBS 135680]EYE90045.1 hypothetical protein EURHEDRAFT_527299 [Aspergillus ruber CBS 135680]